MDMKINKFHELFESSEMVMPDLETLKQLYPDNVNDDPHTLRMLYKADWEKGKYKQELDVNDSSVIDDKIIDIQKELSYKVSEILSVTLHENDNSFFDKLNNLVKEYEHKMPKVRPGTKVIDIDEPFKDETGKIKKFRDPVGETPSVVPKGIVSDTLSGISDIVGSAPSGV